LGNSSLNSIKDDIIPFKLTVYHNCFLTGRKFAGEKKNTMKKLLFLGLLTTALTAGAQSDSVITTRTTRTTTTTHSHKYYYYPSSNVYYDAATDNYVYYDAPATNTWIRVKQLPPNISLDTTGGQVIYYKGENVWVENPSHIKKYKVTRKGVKMKPVRD
jgi:hypothetical protein